MAVFKRYRTMFPYISGLWILPCVLAQNTTFDCQPAYLNQTVELSCRTTAQGQISNILWEYANKTSQAWLNIGTFFPSVPVFTKEGIWIYKCADIVESNGTLRLCNITKDEELYYRCTVTITGGGGAVTGNTTDLQLIKVNMTEPLIYCTDGEYTCGVTSDPPSNQITWSNCTVTGNTSCTNRGWAYECTSTCTQSFDSVTCSSSIIVCGEEKESTQSTKQTYDCTTGELEPWAIALICVVSIAVVAGAVIGGVFVYKKKMNGKT